MKKQLEQRIGHFSKYVNRGATLIGSRKWTSDLQTVAFKNPDGSVVSVVLNRTSEEIPFFFRIYGELVESVAETHSIATYIFE